MWRLLLVTLLYKARLISKQKFRVWFVNEIQRAGAIYVKLAQTASILHDILDRDMVDELKALQSSVILEDIEFSIPGVQVDPVPIGAGSIAQVYKGIYGVEVVAIKVVRPSVLRQVKSIKALRRMLRLAHHVFSNHQSVITRLTDFTRCMKVQVSLLDEGKNMDIFRDRVGSNIIIPRVHWAASSEHILVMEYVPDMVTVYDLVYRDIDSRTQFVQDICRMASHMVYTMGMIHTDVHPGNVYWSTTMNKVVLLDFGAVHTIDDNIRARLDVLNVNYCMGRWREVARNHLQIMYTNFEEIAKNTVYLDRVLAEAERIILSPEPIFNVVKAITKINREHKEVLAVMNKSVTEYEWFIVQVTQLVRIINPSFNVFKAIIEEAIGCTMRTLGKETSPAATVELQHDIFISI